MSLALKISSWRSDDRTVLASVAPGIFTREVAAFSAELATFKTGYGEGRFLDLVRSEGISVYSMGSLRDPEVLKSCLRNDDLWQRLNRAKERLDRNEWPDSLTTKPQVVVSSTSWLPPAIQDQFLATAGSVWPVAKPAKVWRASRERFFEEGPSGSLQKKNPVDAGRVWRRALEDRGLLRRIPGATVNKTVQQCLQWLGVKTIPEHRTPRDFPFFQVGFSDLAKGVPLECGDVVGYHAPIFSSIAIVTKIRPPATPVEVAFLMGGKLCLGNPRTVGDLPTYHRKTRRASDYLVVESSPYEESGFHRPRYLDALAEVEDMLRQTFPATGLLHEARLYGWPGIVVEEWMVTVRLQNGDEIYLHLTVHPGVKKRRLAVVMDFYPWGLKGLFAEETRAGVFPVFIERLKAVDGQLVEWLTTVARNLKYDVFDFNYKMVGPASSSRELLEILHDRGYTPKDSSGWGRLPGKRLVIK